MVRRVRRTDNSGAQLREWLIEHELTLMTDALTPVGFHQGKKIEPPPSPPTPSEVVAAVNDETNVFAWNVGHDLRVLLAGEALHLYRRDLPGWCPARFAGALSDALVLTVDDELIAEDR